MMEMKIKIEAPDLAAAIEKLAAAVAPLDPAILTPDEPRGVSQAPAAPAPAPAPAPVVPVTADPAPAPAANTPVAPAVPVATPPAYTLDQISKAGAALVDAGKMEQLLALLTKYGVAAVTQLNPGQYGTFATELRALGAQI